LIAHADRWRLAELTWQGVHDYLGRVLDATSERLDRDPQADLYFPLLALLHEDMHAEAFLMALQTLGLPAPLRPCAPGLPSSAPLATQEIAFAGGRFMMGTRRVGEAGSTEDEPARARPQERSAASAEGTQASPRAAGGDFVFDNELDAYAVDLAPFALAATTVTQGEYCRFVEAGGYREPRWWSHDGWAWRERTQALHPRYWQRDGADWQVRRFDRLEPLAADLPMIHVNAYEAEAYAGFAGARLPTEAEWEFAARAGLDQDARYPWGDAPLAPGAVNLDYHFGRPVAAAALPQADSRGGLRQLLGNVWEWTASAFLPYPGFAPGPYREYSQPWFGDHRVLRGGSFATRSRLVHNRWRNFYTPDRNDVFAGIRLARSLP
jgi:iron(II)-dependent oxidoreductase